jgi:nucleotide-binding universal stress UspA family protein
LTALNYAAVIADHFGARLIVVSVDDPLLASAADSAGLPPLADETGRELRRFVSDALPGTAFHAVTVDFEVCSGKPATEILRVAQHTRSDLIVISSQGRSGLRKRFFGSTTEHVLRETTIPVLITPRHAHHVVSVEALSHHLKRVVVPVDLTAASAWQARVAGGIALAMGVPLVIAHVLEPVYVPPKLRVAFPGTDVERRDEVETRLRDLVEASGIRPAPEAIVLTGETSEEIVRLADTREAGLIVMGLHSSGVMAPRMGSVAYRVLCMARALVLALPSRPTGNVNWTRVAEAEAVT